MNKDDESRVRKEFDKNVTIAVAGKAMGKPNLRFEDKKPEPELNPYAANPITKEPESTGKTVKPGMNADEIKALIETENRATCLKCRRSWLKECEQTRAIEKHGVCIPCLAETGTTICMDPYEFAAPHIVTPGQHAAEAQGEQA